MIVSTLTQQFGCGKVLSADRFFSAGILMSRLVNETQISAQGFCMAVPGSIPVNLDIYTC